MNSAIRATAARYRRWPNLYYYALGKLWLDPAYPFVAEALRGSSRPLLDIGCGMGLLAVWLRQHGHSGRITGMDVDAAKVAIANAVLTDAHFVAGDARDLPAHQGDVVMLDVLHYFSDADQTTLLRNIAAAVGPGGGLWIRVTLADRSLRYRLTQFEEWFVHASGWIPTSGWNFPTANEVADPLRAEGLTVSARPMWGVTPFNSYLFTARRAE
jgi:2-polyprenyl-3-methyl-5-hydroxy-6-metoxy-1,4-benzoquinol methylase